MDKLESLYLQVARRLLAKGEHDAAVQALQKARRFATLDINLDSNPFTRR